MISPPAIMETDHMERAKQFTKANEAPADAPPLKPYQCSEGYWTVGYGRNLEVHPISREQAEEWFAEDYARATDDASDVLGPSWFAIGEVRRAALTDMAFQMGRAGLAGFRSMLAAIRIGDYDTAAMECLDSRYAQQTPDRARRVSEMLRTGRWAD